ncbi:MAG: hypothetical protein KBT19_09010 [Lachnospiraceae bacterium]|nr:hypothetical protein [Candidatus Colinaster equi]
MKHNTEKMKTEAVKQVKKKTLYKSIMFDEKIEPADDETKFKCMLIRFFNTSISCFQDCKSLANTLEYINLDMMIRRLKKHQDLLATLIKLLEYKQSRPL